MNNKNLSHAVVIFSTITLLAWVLVVPGVVGMQAEAELNLSEKNTISTIALPITTRPAIFVRGWFFSVAKSDYIVKLGTQNLHLAVEHHINQFAIPFYRWAKVTHSVAVINDQGMAAPLPLHLIASTDKLFFGGYATHITAPEIDLNHVLGWHLKANNVSVNIKGVSNQSQQVELTVPSMTVSNDANLFYSNLTNLNFSASSSGDQTATGVWEQQGNFKFEKIETGNNGKPMMSMNNFMMAEELKDRGANVDVIYHTKVGRSVIGDTSQMTADDIHFDFSYTNLNKDGLLKLRTAAREFTDEDQTLSPMEQANQQLARIDTILKQSSGLLASSPGFKIDQFSLTTPHGVVAGTMQVSFNGSGISPNQLSSTTFPELMKQRISGKATLNVARDVFMQATDNKNPAQAINQQQLKAAQLKAFVDQGYVKDDGKQLTMESSFGPQGLLINGKRIM